MATTIGELVWKIGADSSSIKKSFRETDTGAQRLGKILKGVFAGAAVALFAKAVTDLGSKMIGLASGAEETANKFNVVFAGMEAASEAAENLSNNYGLASETSQRLLSDTADLLQGFGVQKDESLALSEATQQLAVDLASFNNKDPEEASRALTSALLGEREAVKSLGIAITDAELTRFADEQGKVYSEMSKAEKAVLTLELAYRQSGNAIGDFERSSSSFSNQLKIARSNVQDLGASIGTDLLPAATAGITEFNKLIGKIIEAREEARETRAAFEAQREGVASLGDQILILEDKIKGLEQAQNNVSGINAVRMWEDYEEKIRAAKNEIQALKDAMEVVASVEAERDDNAATRAQNEADAQTAAEAAAQARIDAANEYLAQNTLITDQLRQQADLAMEDEARERAAAERLEELYARREEIRLQEEADEAARHEERMDNLASELAFYSAYASGVGTIFSNLISVQMAGDDELSERRKRNVIALYRIQQTANIAQIGMDTATAILRQFKDYRYPRALAQSILIGALGATQIAVVAATPPPSLQDGGVIPAAPGGTTVIAGEQGRSEAIVPLDDESGGIGLGTLNLTLDLGAGVTKRMQIALNTREVIVRESSVDKSR